MKTIEYFKLQAKNLHKDFKTQKPYFDSSLGGNFFEYTPRFFDVHALVTDFDIDENNFTLMNAQHLIAKLVGFEKWTDMLKASSYELELAKLLFDNMHKINHEEWQYYLANAEGENDLIFDDEERLDIFKMIFAEVDGHQSYGYDYRLEKGEILSVEPTEIKPKKQKSKAKIMALPLAGKVREKAVKVANWKFEDILQTIEPERPERMRELWDPEVYIDDVIKPDMLPIDRDYALSLVEAFLIHHVIDLANEAEK